MEVVRELYTRWGFEIDEKPLRQLSESIENMKDTVLKAGLAVGAAAGTLFGFAKFTANAAEEAQKMALEIGVNAQELQRMQMAAQLVGVSADELSFGMRFLARNMSDAIRGSMSQRKAFHDLGISMDQVKANDPSAMFMIVADRLNHLGDQHKKASILIDIFGRAGQRMLPFLSIGSARMKELEKRADELGGVMGEDMIKAGMQFNEAFHEMMFAVTGVRNIIGTGLMPVIKPLLKAWTDWIVANRQLIAQKLAEIFKGLAIFVGMTWNAVKALVEAVWRLSESLGGIERLAKIIGVAFAIFTSGALLYGLGAIAIAISLLVADMTLLNAAVLLLPLLIGAAIALLILVIDDILAFFRGDDSVTGVIIEAFGAMWEAIQEWFGGLPGWAQMLATALLFPIRAVTMAIQFIIDLVKTLFGMMSMTDMFQGFAKNIAGLFGFNMRGGFGGNTLSGALGVAPEGSPAGTVPGPNMMNAKVENHMTYNLGAGVDGGMVRSASAAGVKEGNDTVLRNAAAAHGGTGEW